MPRPPLKTVAAIAGVSEPTVSRVLNGREGVSEATRIRVADALAQLGFDTVPEPRPVRRNVVGIVTGEFLNPVFPTLVHHISTELGRRDHQAVIAVTERQLLPEERCIQQLTTSGVDGIVFIAGRHSQIGGSLDHYRALHESGCPIVLVNGQATDLPVPHVRCDERAGAIKAVEHLVQLGHRRIGCLLGSSEYIPTLRFIDGYRTVLARHHIDEPDGSIVETSFTLEGGRAAATRMLDDGITALLAGNDLMALGAVLAARDRGDEHVAVIGYDGTDMTMFTDPPLSTLRQPFEDMAQMIVEAVLGELDDPGKFCDQYVFEPELLARSTSRAPLPVG